MAKAAKAGKEAGDSLPPTGDNAALALRSYIERIERLAEEKAAIGADIREVFKEAQRNGFDTKTMRKAIALRKLEAAKRQEEAHLLEMYLRALGMEG